MSVALAEQEYQLYEPILHKFQQTLTELMSEKGQLREQEERVNQRLREIGRMLLEQWVVKQGYGEVESDRVTGSGGQQLTHRRIGERKVDTIFGTIGIRRMGYGGRHNRSVYPLEAMCAIPAKRYSYALQERACEEATKHAYEQAIQSADKYLGVYIPKRQLLSVVRRVAGHMEGFYATEPMSPSEPARLLVMSMDGKGLVVRNEDLRAETRRKQAKLESKHQHRLCKGEKRYRKRIATVASVYELKRQPRTVAQVIEQWRGTKAKQQPRAQNKRLWANVRDEVQHVADEVVAETRKRLNGQSEVVFISDGDHRMREPMKKALATSADSGTPLPKVTFIIDLIHALERLWTAAHALFGEGKPEVEPWVSKQFERLLSGKASQVAQSMRREATRRKLRANRRKKLDQAAGYLRKYKNDMRYDQYLAKGYPIASGVIEGACKYLVKDRCECTGARWSVEGADALLKLRSIRLSGDWDDFWNYYVQQDQAKRWSQFIWKPIQKSSQPKLRLIHGGESSS